MKKTILHILIYAMFVALICSVVVLIAGSMLGWQTSTQFSDGFFGAGALMFIFGFVSLRGYGYRTTSWPRVRFDSADRAELWAADSSRGRMLMAIFGISGLLLFGLSILVSSVF